MLYSLCVFQKGRREVTATSPQSRTAPAKATSIYEWLTAGEAEGLPSLSMSGKQDLNASSSKLSSDNDAANQHARQKSCNHHLVSPNWSNASS